MFVYGVRVSYGMPSIKDKSLMTCQQFRHSPNLFGDRGACGVWPTKSFHPMLLQPLRAL